jgi:hypothetical protein
MRVLAATGAVTTAHIVDGGDGVRLQGLHSTIPGRGRRALRRACRKTPARHRAAAPGAAQHAPAVGADGLILVLALQGCLDVALRTSSNTCGSRERRCSCHP